MAHFAAVRCAVFMRDTFLGYVWLDLYRFPLIDSEGLACTSYTPKAAIRAPSPRGETITPSDKLSLSSPRSAWRRSGPVRSNATR